MSFRERICLVARDSMSWPSTHSTHYLLATRCSVCQHKRRIACHEMYWSSTLNSLPAIGVLRTPPPTHTHTHIHAHTLTYTLTHTHTYTHTLTHTHAHTHSHAHKHMHACTHYTHTSARATTRTPAAHSRSCPFWIIVCQNLPETWTLVESERSAGGWGVEWGGQHSEMGSRSADWS